MTFEEAFSDGPETLRAWVQAQSHLLRIARERALDTGRRWDLDDELKETWIESSDAERASGF